MRIPDTDAFHFALFLSVPDHHRISSGEAGLSLPGILVGDRMQLRPQSAPSLEDAKRLVLYGHGYTSKEQACVAAHRARRALSLAALESNIGIAWEEWQSGRDVWQGVRAWGRSGGTARGSAITGINALLFGECVTRWARVEVELTAQQQASANLLADFHFDMSGRSRFLLAHAAIETLATNTPKGRAYQKGIDQLAQHLMVVSVNDGTRERIGNDLRNLRQFGITATCEQLVASTLGSEAVSTFTQLSKVRSKIAHHGRDDDVHRSFELYQLAVRLLLRSIKPQTDSA